MNKTDNYEKSSLWYQLENTLFKDIERLDLTIFRKPGSLNSRLASWDPYDKNSFRYYKNILFNLVTSMPQDFFDYYRNIGNTSLGDPISVNINQLDINLDYVFSVQEILFCKKTLQSISNICEIGAGFGRTCHSILKNFHGINRYTIIDLPPCLKLSKKYLKNVLEEADFKKIEFIENTNANNIEFTELFINIDSFAEMDVQIAKSYLSLISTKGNFFYTRNPIGKYHPKMIGLKDYDETQYRSAMSVGLCNEVVDIFNNGHLIEAREKYLKLYCPSSNWILLKNEISYPWQYYHHAMYQRGQ
jgi:putative sugar O-methyltransferase